MLIFIMNLKIIHSKLLPQHPGASKLTLWGQVMHIYISKLAIIVSDNGLSPGQLQRQAIIWTNAGILLIGPLGTNFREILIEIYTFSFRKMHLKMSSGKLRPFCLSLNVLSITPCYMTNCAIKGAPLWQSVTTWCCTQWGNLKGRIWITL